MLKFPPISFPAYGRVAVRDATNYNVNGLVGIAYTTRIQN